MKLNLSSISNHSLISFIQSRLKSDYNSFQANTTSEFLEVYKEWFLSPFNKKNSFKKIEILTNFKNLKQIALANPRLFKFCKS